VTLDPSRALTDARVVVVKIGSSLLVDGREGGQLREAWLAGLAEDAAELRANGSKVVLVSSGSIALGRNLLAFPEGQLTLDCSQAAAAAGQIRLASAYATALGRHGITAAQVLVTLADTQDRRRYLNARATLAKLLEARTVPVINENDTVATDEIRYGDNDRLSARVALMVGADLLVMLSDIDGLYSADPRLDPAACRVDSATEITPDMLASAGSPGSGQARGGMRTKLLAAQTAMQGGCTVAIAEGRAERPLSRLRRTGNGSWFRPGKTPEAARKQWIAGMKPLGRLDIDVGAARALAQGKSLLPAGLVSVSGQFSRGDPVDIGVAGGGRLGAGLTAYSAAEAEKIVGKSLGDVPAALGHAGRGELIHRDDMVLWSAGRWQTTSLG